MRASEVIQTKGIYRDLPNRDKSVAVPTEARWNAPDKSNPWKAGPELATRVMEHLAEYR